MWVRKIVGSASEVETSGLISLAVLCKILLSNVHLGACEQVNTYWKDAPYTITSSVMDVQWYGWSEATDVEHEKNKVLYTPFGVIANCIVSKHCWQIFESRKKENFLEKIAIVQMGVELTHITHLIHCLLTVYSLSIHCLFTAYSLTMHCLFTVYSLLLSQSITSQSIQISTEDE
jgi:hypothetical protein